MEIGATVTFEEIKRIKEEIRASYALAVRDYLEFAYRARFPENEPACVALATCHYNLFLSALSKTHGELSPFREMLHRLCVRFGSTPHILDEINSSMILELMKLTAFQRRNSPSAVASYSLVVAVIAHTLWSALADQAPKQTRAA
jgi:hypothetical protein